MRAGGTLGSLRGDFTQPGGLVKASWSFVLNRSQSRVGGVLRVRKLEEGNEGGGAARAKAARQEEQMGDPLSREGVVVRKGVDEGAGQTVGLAGPVQIPVSRPRGQHALKKGELQRALI